MKFCGQSQAWRHSLAARRTGTLVALRSESPPPPAALICACRSSAAGVCGSFVRSPDVNHFRVTARLCGGGGGGAALAALICVAISFDANSSTVQSCAAILCFRTCNQRQTYQSPACIYKADRDLSIAGMYIQSRQHLTRTARRNFFLADEIPKSGCSAA